MGFDNWCGVSVTESVTPTAHAIAGRSWTDGHQPLKTSNCICETRDVKKRELGLSQSRVLLGSTSSQSVHSACTPDCSLANGHVVNTVDELSLKITFRCQQQSPPGTEKSSYYLWTCIKCAFSVSVSVGIVRDIIVDPCVLPDRRLLSNIAIFWKLF